MGARLALPPKRAGPCGLRLHMELASGQRSRLGGPPGVAAKTRRALRS